MLLQQHYDPRFAPFFWHCIGAGVYRKGKTSILNMQSRVFEGHHEEKNSIHREFSAIIARFCHSIPSALQNRLPLFSVHVEVLPRRTEKGLFHYANLIRSSV